LAALWFSLLLVSLGGCSRQPAVQEQSEQELSQPEDTPKGEPLTPPDRSLTSDEYIRLGMPAHDRPWSGADMTAAAKVLTTLAEKDPGLLPRYQSERSGEVFARLVAVEQNLAVSKNKTLPVGPRIDNYADYLKSANKIAKLYASAFIARKLEGAEMIEFLGALLRIEVIAWPLVDEYFLSLDKKDGGRKDRMAEREQMKQGLAGMVASAVFCKSFASYPVARR
jgi:hypothetical protein